MNTTTNVNILISLSELADLVNITGNLPTSTHALPLYLKLKHLFELNSKTTPTQSTTMETGQPDQESSTK